MAREGKAKGTGARGQSNRLWLWAALVVLAVVAAGFWLWQTQNQKVFAMEEGSDYTLVLIRNESDATYRVRYIGNRPTELQSLQVMLAGEILHVDVQQVAIRASGDEIILERDGSLPEGQTLTLQPDDELSVRITLLGQTLGTNYLYGFRIAHGDPEKAKTFELKLEFDYAISVE